MSTISASTTSTTAFKITTDTTGALVFQTGASPTTAMTINGSQNVGIGTSTPAYNLHVVDTVAAVGSVRGNLCARGNFVGATDIAHLYFNNASDIPVANIYALNVNGGASDSGTMVFRTASAGSLAERMRLDSAGNLGLGVTPSAWSAGKAFEIGAVGNSLWGFSSSDVYLTSNAYYNAAWKYASNNAAGVGVYEINGATHYWYRAASGTANATASLSTSMVLDASGNLGVGVTTVGQKLEIGSSGTVYAKISSSTNSSFRGVQFGINGDSNTYGAVAMEVNGGELRTTAGFGGWGGYQTFYTNGSERARIDTSGNVLVNVTSAPISASRGLYVAGLISPYSNYSPASNIGGQIAFSGAQGSPVCGRVFMGDNTGWQWEWGPYGGSGWVRRFYFTDGGAAYSTTGTWGTISDARLKENIVDATPKLSDVMRLRVRNFNFITEPNNKQLGFIAQEVEEVFPRAVDETRPDDDGNTTKSVKTTVLIPILVKAIQEQQAIITQLTSRIETLEAA